MENFVVSVFLGFAVFWIGLIGFMAIRDRRNLQSEEKSDFDNSSKTPLKKQRAA